MWAGPTRRTKKRGTTSILKIERSTKGNTLLKNRDPNTNPFIARFLQSNGLKPFWYHI